MKVRSMKIKIFKITKKGQITIPVEIRKQLNIKEEDLLAITTEKEYILIKKVEFPKWEDVFSRGETIAKEIKITQDDVIKACSEVRHAK